MMARVMIVLDSYRVTGPAKIALEFCSALAGRIEPRVVIFQRGSQEPELREACERRGLRIHALRERCRFDPTTLIEAGRIARSFRPDLVETNGYKADVIGLALQRRFGLPWIAVSHGVTNEGPKMRLYWFVDRLIIRYADRIVAVSGARRQILEAEGCPPERLVTIQNAVELPVSETVDVTGIRAELGLDVVRPVVAAVGRLSPEKGHSYFIEAMAEVAKAIPEVRGLIVGDGQEEQPLRSRAQALGLGETIRFAGYRRDMNRIYPAVDLVVLPSLSEGLPMVALEGMAHGLPVVGTRVGGIPEVLDDGVSGLLVPPADAGALAQAIVMLLRNPALRLTMGRAGRERVEFQFSLRTRAERMLSVYRDVCRGRNVQSEAPSQ
jgi:glycosyltransferase involved in cell wall biosynthesis